MKPGRLQDAVWDELPIPPAAPRRGRTAQRRAAGFAAAAAALAVVGAAGLLSGGSSRSGATACGLVTPDLLRTTLGWEAGAGVANVSDGDPPPGTTVCNIGPAVGGQPGGVTVFSVVRDADAFYDRPLRDPAQYRDISGPGYRATAIEDPPRFQTFFLVKHGQYVNVLLYELPAGSAERLARAVAAAIP